MKGRVLGNESSIPSGGSVRAISPLASVMQVLDVQLPSSFAHELNAVLPQLPGCFIGAQPKTQCLEIAHANR